jgi:hypothetical protein
MSYSIDMPGSARRNILAAETLRESRSDVSGYLYGLATECAVKAMMIEIGIRPMPAKDRQSDPHYQHFPELLISARNMISGRASATLSRILAAPDFMANWHIKMRYAKAGDVSAASVERWSKQAKQTVGAIGT